MRPIPYANADPTRRARWAKLHLPELFPMRVGYYGKMQILSLWVTFHQC